MFLKLIIYFRFFYKSFLEVIIINRTTIFIFSTTIDSILHQLFRHLNIIEITEINASAVKILQRSIIVD